MINKLEEKFWDKYNLLEAEYQVKSKALNIDPNVNFPKESVIASSDQLNKLREEANEAFLPLRKYSNEHVIYHDFCSFEVYTATYPQRLAAFLVENYDATEKDFIKDELWYIDSDSDLVHLELIGDVKYSFRRKAEFLKGILVKPISKNASLTPFQSAYLFDKLGIRGFLEEKGYNTTQISKIISKLTGKNLQNTRSSFSKLEKSISKLPQGNLNDISKLDDFFNSL